MPRAVGCGNLRRCNHREARHAPGHSLLAALAATAAPAQTTHWVTVAPDGGYSPSHLVIAAGDEVVWTFPERGRAVVELSAQQQPACDAFAAWDAAAENGFTGPMPQAASGIMALGPNEESLAVFAEADAPQDCVQNERAFTHGGDYLCRDDTLPQGHPLDEVLENPDVSGVFLRFDWSAIEPEPGRYDFAAMDVEIDRAVAAGKLYSLSFRAGRHGTPEWLGATLHLPILQLRDSGSHAGGEEDGCGAELFLGDPTDTAYAQRYVQMLRGVAEHLKENAARWRALAYSTSRPTPTWRRSRCLAASRRCRAPSPRRSSST